MTVDLNFLKDPRNADAYNRSGMTAFPNDNNDQTDSDSGLQLPRRLKFLVAPLQFLSLIILVLSAVASLAGLKVRTVFSSNSTSISEPVVKS